MSNFYAKGERVKVPGYSFTNFSVCPDCHRRLRLTWNGKFFRHKRVLGAGSSVKSGEPQP